MPGEVADAGAGAVGSVSILTRTQPSSAAGANELVLLIGTGSAGHSAGTSLPPEGSTLGAWATGVGTTDHAGLFNEAVNEPLPSTMFQLAPVSGLVTRLAIQGGVDPDCGTFWRGQPAATAPDGVPA